MFNIHIIASFLIITLSLSFCNASEIYYALREFDTLVNLNDLSMKKTSQKSIADVLSNQKLDNESNITNFPVLYSCKLLVIVGNGKLKFYKINCYTDTTFYLCNMRYQILDTNLYKLDNRTSESPLEYYVADNKVKSRSTNVSMVIYGDIVTLNFSSDELDYLKGFISSINQEKQQKD